ncbi:LysR substrate-binding domain-containing protein [Trinickia sp. NRRL B-1857]|uniref:LysR substrate-binding domain-containing protein n=1 Tax=Trinickia sp. NRRL B-1857 TaxID=3162879 RepID=UPI003D26CFB9
MAMLIAAVDKGSLSAAARDLNVPVPTLTRKVGDLEAQLGTKLLTRTTRKLTLTDTGFAYVAAARRILDLVQEQEREAAGEFTAPRGDLVVASSNLFGRTHVLPLIADFIALFPEINVKLMQSDRNVDLVDDRVDLAVRLGALPDSGMIATRVGSFRVVVCASPAFIAGHRVPQHPSELLKMPCVMFNGPMLSPEWSFKAPATGERLVVPVTPRLQVSTPDSAVDAATRGVGFTQLLHYHVAHEVDEGRLQIVLPEFEVERVPIHLVHVSRNLMPLKLRCFIDFVAPRLRESLARFQ